METVSVSREITAPPDAVRERMQDVGPFMRAAGFDEVEVDREGQSPSGSRPQAGDGDQIGLTNGVGIATIELSLELVEDPDAALAYRQVEGIFEEMVTRYTVEPTGSGTQVTAETEFAIDVALVGKLMDATVIKRQRRKELEQQFDWLAAELGDQTE
ncbi:SRPBCC family protein [Halolamina salifodinae]|uniref:Carbon monoxide dehydrogenase subunit G n=1 Tax=Halolamina salifodinae TaxID=1202767 RepID=A0A8T4H4Z1_9EURY|nr:SRPBCC family protein [Halolamina salifodinae]MBP1988188.1 carbon monoxide dehydrogenase subunit G [Halolamina salifodinae]